MSYSIDLKERVLSFIEEDGSKVKASRIFKVNLRSIFLWIKRKKEKGNLENKKIVSRRRKIDGIKLKDYVYKHPDHYLREIADVFKVSTSAIFYALKRQEITYKKKFTLQRKRREFKTRFSEEN